MDFPILLKLSDEEGQVTFPRLRAERTRARIKELMVYRGCAAMKHNQEIEGSVRRVNSLTQGRTHFVPKILRGEA